MSDPEKKPTEYPLPKEAGLYLQKKEDGDEAIVQIFRLPSGLALQAIGNATFFLLDDSFKTHQFKKVADVKIDGNIQKFIWPEPKKQAAQSSENPAPDITPAAK